MPLVKDTSIVIVGQVNQDTVNLTTSIRQFLPASELIISTWESCYKTKLKELLLADKVIYNKDPGAEIFDFKAKKENNVNRIIVSSQNGIKASSGQNILRIRSDMILLNARFLTLFDYLSYRDERCSLFKERVIAYPIFSIKRECRQNKYLRTLFHVSDWCYYGLKEDLTELFNIKLVKEPEFSQYFKIQTKSQNDIYPERFWRMSPEQYITSENAKKIFPSLKFDSYLDITREGLLCSDKFIFNNFLFFSPFEWGIEIAKEQYRYIDMKYEYDGADYYNKTSVLNDQIKLFSLAESTQSYPPRSRFQVIMYKIKKAYKIGGVLRVFIAAVRLFQSKIQS